ncbi:sulfotransferase 2B1-like [Gymnodraco acuticeps]|uniref:Sulfotransferase n=1 Tax=Gymnodraco acuticeps TaxID=8218 RepID=A0A6P8X4A2_GYMAC|nr:sulfotransferase 2B1-like [Gymnodraco acuticeps]
MDYPCIGTCLIINKNFHPSTGTHWMKEIVPLIMSGGDPEPVDNIVNWKRVPWLELQQTASLELEQRPSPRLLTTHFQYNMMPPSFFEVKPKVIYVTRNPKDVFTSSFHHHEAASFLVDPGPQTQFLHKFLDGKGTHWMKEIVPLIMSGGDPEPVDNIVNWKRVPWLELQQTASLELEQRPSPRLLTTHFQYNMMPPSFFEVKPKVIYVTRNPKDVFTSSFHHHEAASFLVDPGPQTQFLHNFLDGKVLFGSWFDHVKSWLNAEDEEHIMHISYEQMIMDLKDSVCNMAQFLQTPLDHEAIEKIADRCLFKNMKKNNMSNYSTVPRELLDQTKSGFLRKVNG